MNTSDRSRRVVCVVGARPNFMKIKPIVDALDLRQVAVTLVHTGQHYDAAMTDVFFEDLCLRPPDVCLGLGSGSHAEQMAGVMVAIERLVLRESPDAVVVVGDVNSTLGAAMAAAKAPCLVAHVEAGLRSGDWTMPEEVNRVVTDRLSDLLFAPSEEAVMNLRKEGFQPKQIHLVGDVMAETLLRSLSRARRRPILDQLGVTPLGYALVTMHRPSNVDDPSCLVGLLDAVGRLAEEIPVVFPVHPRTQARMRQHALSVPAAVRATGPLGYLDFVALEAEAQLVLTDSGSVQAEANVLGLPCLILRDTTERWETVSTGCNQLVGTDPERILDAARVALGQRRHRLDLYPVAQPVGREIVDTLLANVV